MADSSYYFAKDVMALMEVKERKAYDIISMLNRELIAMGKVTLRGRVLKSYFHQRTDVDVVEITKKGKQVRIAR